MKLVFIAASMLLAATVSQAQTVHPCDVIPPVNPTVKRNTVIVGFCHDKKDADGATIGPASFKIYIDNFQPVVWTFPTPLLPTPNSQGDYYFEAPAISITKGPHVVAVTTVDIDESAPTPWYQFTIQGSGPNPPKNPRVK